LIEHSKTMLPTIPPPFEPAITLPALIDAIGAALSLLLGFALWFKRSAQTTRRDRLARNPDKIFSLIMLVIGILLVESFLETTGYLFFVSQLMTLQFVLAFVLGPLFFIYIKTITSTGTGASLSMQRVLVHMLPAVLVLLVLSPSIFNPDINSKVLAYFAQAYSANIGLNVSSGGLVGFDANILLRTDELRGRIPLHGILGRAFLLDMQTGFTGVLLLLSLLTYLGLGFLALRRHKKTIRQLSSYSQGIDLKWVFRFLLLLLVVALVFLVRLLVTDWLGYPEWYVLADGIVHGCLSIAVVYLGYQAFAQTTIFPAVLASDSQNEEKFAAEMTSAVVAEEAIDRAKYGNSALPESASEQVASELHRRFESDKYFLDPVLTLPDLASRLGLSTHVLSQVLNQTIGMNFFDFVNQYRIEEAKLCLQAQDKRHLPISTIALNSGFNSNSTFYTAFKKHVGLTPTQWRKANLAD